jgi:urate oxidase
LGILSDKHLLQELKVQVLLEGKFDDSFYKGNNNSIVATETQKNLMYFYSKKYSPEPIEVRNFLPSNFLISTGMGQ